jgi:hypothetical protein
MMENTLILLGNHFDAFVKNLIIAGRYNTSEVNGAVMANNRINMDWQFRCTPFPAGFGERSAMENGV